MSLPRRPRRPEVDLAACTMCEGCLEVAPQVFELNPAGDWIQVREMDEYPAAAVDEAIKLCPGRAIAWRED